MFVCGSLWKCYLSAPCGLPCFRLGIETVKRRCRCASFLMPQTCCYKLKRDAVYWSEREVLWLDSHPDQLNIWSLEKVPLVWKQLVPKWRFLHPSRFDVAPSVLAVHASFPGGICRHPAPAQHSLGKRCLPLPLRVPNSKAAILSYANELCKCKRSDIKTISLFFFFLSRRLFIRDYLLLLLLFPPAACSATMARTGRKNQTIASCAFFEQDGVAAWSASWATFPALENLTGVKKCLRRAFLFYIFWRKNKTKNKRRWAAGSAFRRRQRSLPAIVSTLSSFFLNWERARTLAQYPQFYL